MIPVFNEIERIVSVINNVIENYDQFLDKIIVIDDCSDDGTNEEVLKLSGKDNRVILYQNTENLGHGKSLILGLKMSLRSQAKYILTYDGDGFIQLPQINKIIEITSNKNFQTGEGIRRHRIDKIYRKFVTRSIAIFCTVYTRQQTKDANTPLRIHSVEFIKSMCEEISADNPVPNIYFSIRARKLGEKVPNFEVISLPEPKLSERNSWESSMSFLPSKKFISFCLKAMIFWKYL